MEIESLLLIVAFTSFVAVVGVFFLALQFYTFRKLIDFQPIIASLGNSQEKLERVLKDESSRSREEANANSKELREELSTQARGLQDSVLKTMVEMQTLQKSQFQSFSESLAEGVRGIDRRVEGMANVLKEGINETRNTVDSRQQTLQKIVDNKLSELQKSSEDSNRELREEIGKSLKSFGDGVDKRQQNMQTTLDSKLSDLRKDTAESNRGVREEVQSSLKSLGAGISETIGHMRDAQNEKLSNFSEEVGKLSKAQDRGQENLRKTVEQRLDTMRIDNTEKLEKIRKTVDEQLQGTLEKRLGESFKLVSDRLEQVHKGLGEMQSLANGVGDLKKVLTNVKTRGTWGEVQLGNLLEQMLTADQFEANATTKPGSQERVEFAIRLPGKDDNEKEVLLPIDAKFPSEDYERLVIASDNGDVNGVEIAAKQLDARIKSCAKDIRDKYINPPHTTDFAILFLPTEGLYAEVLRRPGTAEQIQRDYRVTLAGPTTLAATLNALQMGFRTLAIQKRSSEVWQVLEAVKAEFGKYGTVLEKVQKKLHEASKTIDNVSVRKRAIDRKLKEVGTNMEDEKAEALLGIEPSMLIDDELETGPT